MRSPKTYGLHEQEGMSTSDGEYQEFQDAEQQTESEDSLLEAAAADSITDRDQELDLTSWSPQEDKKKGKAKNKDQPDPVTRVKVENQGSSTVKQEPKMSDPAGRILEDLTKVQEKLIKEVTPDDRDRLRDRLINLLTDIGKLPESNGKDTLKNLCVNALGLTKVQFKPVDIIEDLKATRESLQAADRQVQNGISAKMSSRINKFDGENPDYPWSKFYACYRIAVSNATYRDDELKAIFLGCLEGSALSHYTANEAEFAYLDYFSLLKKFEERFDSTKRSGINDIVGMTQGANEEVLAFKDRLVNAARSLLPPIVPKRRFIIKSDGTTENVENPLYDIQVREREVAIKQHELYLVKFFIAGLRDEILARLTTVDYSTLDDAVRAAKTAEDYLLGVKQIRTHHLRVESKNEASTNALPALQEMERRDGSRSRSSDRKQGECYNCGKFGHWARDCRAPPRKGSRASSKERKERGPKKSKISQLENKIADLTEQLKSVMKDQRRSTSRGRQGSKSPHRGRRTSKSPFRKRSDSRGSRGSRYGSRSRSNSRSKN